MSTMSSKSRGSGRDVWTWTTTTGLSGRVVASDGTVLGDAPADADVDAGRLASLSVRSTTADGWGVDYLLLIDADRAQVGQIVLTPTSPIDALDAAMSRRLGIVELQRRIQRHLPLIVGLMPPAVGRPRFAAPKPGRRGHSDEQYAAWAHAYVQAIDQDSRRPVKLMVERLGEDGPTWRRRLKEAERRGMLEARPAGTQGRAGGQLTAKAERLLGIDR